MYTTNICPKTNEIVNPCVNYRNDTINFSNGVSSVFSIKRDLGGLIIKPNWLSENMKIVNKPIKYDAEQNDANINKIIINLMSKGKFELNMIELNELVYKDKMFSLVELKLIKKLLENPKMYMSRSGLALIAENKKGSAYILGKDKKGQRTF